MPNTIWKPHPRQEEALKRIEFEILYGGARGGGKTDAGLVWLTDHIINPRYRALVIRKNADDLSDWVDRATRMYSLLGAKIAYRPAEITFPSGATIKTGHLKDDQAYTKYQGHEYQRILIEELTQVPDEKRYLQLLASCRSTVEGIKPQVFNTTNPGGIGHGWVKRRFVDVGQPNQRYSDRTSGRTRIYIPARIDDNPTLLKADPDYINFLESLRDTDVELWKAWRLGDWDTFAGQYFKEFRHDLHVCKPFTPKPELTFVGGMDWGRTAPFACLVSVVIPQVYEGVNFNRVITFCEAYGTEKTPKEWAEVIQTKLHEFGLSVDNLRWIQADPAMFTKGNDGSISIADQFTNAHHDYYKIKPGSNDRVGGWELLHNWLSLAPDGLPYWLITENCINLIRTLPELVHDDLKVEDVDCFVKGTHISTPHGDKNIEDIKVGDLVDTPIGPKRVIKAGVSGNSERVVTAYLSDFKTVLRGTANHKVFVHGKGLIELQKLENSDILGTKNTTWINSSNTMGSLISVKKEQLITILKLNMPCISKSIGIILEIFQKVGISIIRILTQIITLPQILWLYLPKNMDNSISNIDVALQRDMSHYMVGVKAQQEKPNLGKTPIKCSSTPRDENLSAEIVEKLNGLLARLKYYVLSFVVTKTESSDKVDGSAPSVAERFKRLIKKQLPVHILAVGNYGKEIVYRLTVEEAHLYYANGILVTNTTGEDHAPDAVRYMFKALQWIDAKVGGVHPRQRVVGAKLIKSPIMSINLGEFEKDKKITKDWRSV